MKTMKCLGFLLMLLFSAASVMGQSKVVLSQELNAVTFSSNEKLWGLEVNGKVIFPEKYRSVSYQNGLFSLENTEGKWAVCDKTGKIFTDWVKATSAKISESFVVFENANGGNTALSYERGTWVVKHATETTYASMYEETMAKNKDKGTTLNYESQSEKAIRIYNTQPRVVSQNGKQKLMFKEVQLDKADEVIPLTKDYDADDIWFFKAKDDGLWGVIYVKKTSPTKSGCSISFNYTKIESANNGYRVLNCYLPDGSLQQIWWDGMTTAEKSVPTTAPAN